MLTMKLLDFLNYYLKTKVWMFAQNYHNKLHVKAVMLSNVTGFVITVPKLYSTEYHQELVYYGSWKYIFYSLNYHFDFKKSS